MATMTLPETGVHEKSHEKKNGSPKGTTTKYVYFFGGGKADGHGKMKDDLAARARAWPR